jgi:hypothetical protein
VGDSTTFKDPADNETRLTITVSSAGNRTDSVITCPTH